jgi:hypothetical protein
VEKNTEIFDRTDDWSVLPHSSLENEFLDAHELTWLADVTIWLLSLQREEGCGNRDYLRASHKVVHKNCG